MSIRVQWFVFFCVAFKAGIPSIEGSRRSLLLGRISVFLSLLFSQWIERESDGLYDQSPRHAR
jgi:hypothetical protein